VRFVPDLRDNEDERTGWIDFQLRFVPELLAEGWRIDVEDFPYRVHEPDAWDCRLEAHDGNGWFGLELGVEVEGRRIDLLPILLDALRQFPLTAIERGELPVEHVVVGLDGGADQGQALCLPMKRMLPLMQLLLELHGGDDAAGPTPPRLSRIQLARLSALAATDEDAPLQWLGDADARDLVERLRRLDAIPGVEPPHGLAAQLRPYQASGLAWLQFLTDFRFGGILADDMGLGKTLQTLAHVLAEKEAGRADRPSLVVAPTSLLFNWAAEARRFTPDLSVLLLHGPERKARFAAIPGHDLVLTSYPLLVRDREALSQYAYHLAVFDEAQWLKNPAAKASRAARSLEARHRLCLTGTPMENHLGELWALFDLLMPGLLGERKRFTRLFRTPIEKHGNTDAATRLARRVRPFLLRRTKHQVAAELPEKTEILQSVVLSGRQRELYETVRLAMHRRVRDEIARQGLERSHIVVLDALLKLRQVCCDSRLVAHERAHEAPSAKLELLLELLPEMVEEGRRILLFSQFTGMLDLIETEVRAAGIDYCKLTGRTRNREAAVNRFQEGGVPLFLISLKAGVVGLNLTAADTVIHYDPWWNPAAERQATDRAHRIGQRKPVFVYKLICSGTLEERIQVMQQRKQALADGVYGPGEGQEPQWSPEDLDTLFAPMADQDRAEH